MLRLLTKSDKIMPRRPRRSIVLQGVASCETVSGVIKVKVAEVCWDRRRTEGGRKVKKGGFGAWSQGKGSRCTESEGEKRSEGWSSGVGGWSWEKRSDNGATQYLMSVCQCAGCSIE